MGGGGAHKGIILYRVPEFLSSRPNWARGKMTHEKKT
jgi:hypothetical protein